MASESLYQHFVCCVSSLLVQTRAEVTSCGNTALHIIGKQANTVRSQSGSIPSPYVARADQYSPSPLQPGVPTYRTKVLYIPQRPSLLPGTPQDFLRTIVSYSSRHTKSTSSSKNHHTTNANDNGEPDQNQQQHQRQEPWQRALKITKAWGMDPALWQREWATLSGGEGQRMSLAVAVSLGQAEVILLDGQSIVKRRNPETLPASMDGMLMRRVLPFFRPPG